MSLATEFHRKVLQWAARSLAEQPVDHPQKLPFVYQLTYNGVESLALGTNHSAPDRYHDHAQELLTGKKYLLLENLQRKLDFYDRYNQITSALNIIARDKKAKTAYRRRKEEGQYRLTEYLRATISTHTLGTPYPLSVESRLREAAKHQGASTHGLETIAEMNGKWPECEQPITPPFMLTAWLNGSEQIMQTLDEANFQLMLNSATHAQRKYQTKRNNRLVTRSLPYLESPSIVAVGAAHLCGARPTMLDIYQEKGITVKRI